MGGRSRLPAQRFDKRLTVGAGWFWRWLTYQRGARLIDEDPPPRRPGEEAHPLMTAEMPANGGPNANDIRR